MERKNRKRTNKKIAYSSPVNSGNITEKLKSMLKFGGQIAAGSGIAALFTAKVYNVYNAIDTRIESNIGRALAKAAVGVLAGTAMMAALPSMPLLAGGVAGYAIFLGGMDLFGPRELPAPSVNLTLNPPARTPPVAPAPGTPPATMAFRSPFSPPGGMSFHR